MKKFFLIILVLLTVPGCFKAKTRELKSPCVAIESFETQTPCVKRPANASWLS
ncbi:MAG: DUF2706 domain-containing protein [Alphaproteobacteria bacterium]